MFIITGLMLTEILLSYLLRRKNLYRIHNVITVPVWMLLFILGVEVGGNEQVIKGLHTIGIGAIILTLGGALGSVIVVWALREVLYKKKGEAA